MSYRGFGRGRGYGPRGTRAKGPFRLYFPPFRHVAPPRPRHPPFISWQQNNSFYQIQLPQANQQFRLRGRGRRICNYDQRYTSVNNLPTLPDCEEIIMQPPPPPPLLPSNSPQAENNQINNVPQVPLPGSEEERQQKITETADRLKQKLSSFNSDKITDIWNDDVPLPSDTMKDGCIENRGIPELRYEPPELNLTYNDLKDIGRINPNHSKSDTSQHTTDTFSVNLSNINNEIILDKSTDECEVEIIASHKIQDSKILPDNEYIAKEKRKHHKPSDNSNNFKRSDLNEDNIETELLESNIRSQCDTLEDNVSQKHCDPQQGIVQKIEIRPIDVAQGQNTSVARNLQNVSFPTDLTDQNISREDMSQGEKKSVTNLEIQKAVLSSHVRTKSSDSNHYTISQSPLPDVLISNNIMLDNHQLLKIKEISSHSAPPKLSPHTERELPIDFDPSTPPPILLKQDQPCTLPSFPVYDLPLLFNPTEPPPNMRHLVESKMSHENARPAWNINTGNQVAFKNRDVHTELNKQGGFQQLSLEISSQTNAFLPSHIDKISFPSLFSISSSDHPRIETNVPLALPRTQQVSHNTYAASSSVQEPLPFSDLHCNISKDDGLNDMQEAMKFAKQMASITEKRNKESNFTSLSESRIQSVGDIESISLPPDKPKTRAKLKRKQDKCSKKLAPEEHGIMGYKSSSEEAIVQVHSKPTDTSLMDEQDRPKVVFNLSNKTRKVNSMWQQDASMKKCHKRNDITQPIESDETYAASPVVRQNVENTIRRDEMEENISKSRNSNSEDTVLSNFTNQNTTSPYKRIQRDVYIESSQHSDLCYRRSGMLRSSKNHVEKDENSNSETSWKNQIIGRFLKMSKNEIYNMVNNTSRRKFDVIMKRLVKEKRSTLSLEMRHVQDEKMKQYDQQEFMKQLNAMLEPDATVAITDLPNEFIHHLNEVLQLDVLPSNHITQSESSSTSLLDDANDTFNPVTCTVTECTATSSEINQECIRNKHHTARTAFDKDVQTNDTRTNDFNTKDDACSTKSNRSSTSSKLSILQHDLDDIFSEVTRKNQTPASMRKNCIAGLRNTNKSDDNAVSKNAQKETCLEDDRSSRSENCARWVEKCDRWKRKNREDPYTYRNLTKEEWEAMYGIQVNPTTSFSVTKKTGDDKNLSNKIDTTNPYKRRRHSSESSKFSNKKHKIVENDKHKRSRRHSDERKQTANYSNDSSSSNCTTSSSSSSSSSNSSSDSSDRREPNVTKLLRVIKEKEKVAKKMSLNETIRDEVNAEIERERKQKGKKSHRNRKSTKRPKEKREHHKRDEKLKKKTASPSDCSLQGNETEASRLLMENEIKKEKIEDQVTQKVVIKEELDISQDENIVFTSASSHYANVETKIASLHPEFPNKPESPLVREISMMTVDSIESHSEDKPPTSSPTQPKTKAQLKQMPETTDTDDNKVSLPSGVTEDRDSMINSTDISKCPENSNNNYQAIEISYNEDKVEIRSTINNLINQDDNVDNNARTSHDRSDKNPVHQSNAIVHISVESSANPINIPKNNEIAVSTSNVTSTVASASSIPITSIATQKQVTNRKIDIKTYYERAIQRRMNEQGESKKLAEESVVMTQNLLSIPKAMDAEVAMNNSISVSTHNGSINDPQLAKSVVPHYASNKNDIAQMKSEKYSQKDSNRESEVAELALKHSEKCSVVNTDSAIKRIDKCKSEDRILHTADTANINTLSNTVTIPKVITRKSKKFSKAEANVTGKKLQNKVSDPRKFKNIRSEGGKELKLKKEMVKTQKTKRKSIVASKSADLTSTKIYRPRRIAAENTKKVIQEKEMDNSSDASKIDIKCTQAINPYLNKINNNDTKMELATIFSENTDNHNSESSHDTDKTKECLSEPKVESRNIEEDIRNTNAHDQLSITTMQNEEACNIEQRNDTPSVEIANEKSLNAREISNIVPESDMSIDPIISNPEIKISNNTEEIYKEKLSLTNENQQTNTKDMELSSNQNKTNEIEAEKLKKEDLLGSTNIPVPIEKCNAVMIPEMDVTSRLNVIDTQGELHDIYGPGSKNESGKITELPVLNKHSQGEQNTENGIISPDSVGSPFKGFLEESIITFEQPNLLNIELDGIGADKEDKLLLDKHSVSCIIDPENYKEMEIERQRDYEMLDSVTDYTNDISISANEICSVTFGDTLLSSNKNANKKTDKSDLTTNENRERSTEKSSSDVVTTTLHQNKNINTDEDIETEKQLVIEEKYTSDTELEVKRAVFINEEETMQDENRSKDFIDKLTTTTDPSLSDALDTAASDETLRLSEIPTIEQLDNHIYLETNTSLEKMSCDKSPDFDTDEHLDNMFYLDVRLQSTTFDSKDDVSAHFSDHRPSLQCEITPTITPESTMIVPCSDSSHDEMQKPEQCEFNFQHISPTDSDCNLLAKMPMQHSPIDTPRTLNIPTKAALKETARDLFLKSPNNISMTAKRDGISEKTQQDETVDSYQTSAWQLDIFKNVKPHPQETQSNTTTHDITNVNTTLLTQCSANDVSVNTNANTSRSISLASSDVHHSTTHHSPVIELEKMKEPDNGREKETKKVSEKIESAINRNRKKLKSSILHKLKDNQRMKHRSQTDPLNRKTLSKKLRNMKQSGKLSGNTKEAILARMLEIDIEMHKLTTEKLKLHEMLQNNVSVESSASNNTISTQETQQNENVVSVQPEVSLTLTMQSVQNSTETSNAELNKHLSPPKQSSAKQRNRTISHSSEDEEIIHYTQKMKTPVIRWKKIPRLDQTIKQRDQAEEEEGNQGETRERLTSSPTITKTTDSSIDVSKNTVQEPDPNMIIIHDVQVQQTSTKNDKKSDCNIDTSARSTIYLSKNTISRQSEPQNSTERESNNTEHLLIQKNNDVDKKNENLVASEAARINSQSNMQAHSTPEPLSIYSDDSTWDSLVNTASELHEKRKSTGLALLEETFKKELAISRKVKAVARKQKKKQLNNFLKSVNNLTVEEEDLPLSKLYIRKLQQKRDLLDTLSQRKEDVIVDSKILDNMEEVINAVAEDRVEDLYGSQSEARVPLDIPSTSNASSVPQAERHQFYVDVETNANPDWPCQEKENVEEIALQWQNDDNVSDKSSRAFTVVNQNKVPICDERNVEPDSSLTPEETLESHSSDYEHVRSKELNNKALRSFDIRVSVPKILIQDNFSLGLLQKFENTTDNGSAEARLVDSTTNAFNATSVKKLEENREGDEIRRDTLSTIKPTIKPTVEKDKKREDSEMNLYEKDKCAIDANSNKQNIASRELQKQETTDNVRDTQSDVQSNTARIKYSNIIENENSDSVVSNGCDKITAIDLMRDVISSDSISKNIGAEHIQNSSGNVENKIAAKEEKSYLENKSHAFKTIINSNQRMSSPLPTDSIEPVSENSEESNEMSIEKRHSPEPTTTSVLSFSKAIKNIETNKKLVHRKKYSKSTAVRRSIRYINENVKPSKINEVNANSNSSEQEQNIHEKDLTTHRKSKSPVRDERIINTLLNVRKNRGSQKVQDTNVRNVIGAELEKNVDNPVKSHPTVLTECATSKNKNVMVEKKRKHTKWQMMNCKVRLIDCKHTLLKPNVSSEILREFGIIIVNPYVPTGTLCDRHNLVIPAAISEKSSLPVDNLGGKNKFKIEILEDIPIKKDNEDDLVQESTSRVVEDNQEPVRMQYTVHKGPILDIKVFENSFLAASEDGKIYRYSRTSNGILNIYKGHKSAVTCLYIYKSDIANINKELMYSGSLDGTLRCYNITTGALIKNHVQINSPIQCMDQAWGLIFIGTKSGHVSRFHIKTGVVKGSNIQFSDKSVLALKATNEGPRKILIVASRNQPITIRDAQTGLFLRSISSQKNHTVYSLMRHHNFIYCGTSSTSINVFNFTTGEQAIQYEAGVGIVCMRLYEELLFAGCYDGNIYVFDINNHKLICSIPGPGNMLLSIEVVHDKIIAGSKDKRLHSWQMPSQVRALLHKIT